MLQLTTSEHELGAAALSAQPAVDALSAVERRRAERQRRRQRARVLSAALFALAVGFVAYHFQQQFSADDAVPPPNWAKSGERLAGDAKSQAVTRR